MSRNGRVRFDLDEIWEFIRADSLDAAERTVAEILAAVGALVSFPGSGHKRPDVTSRSLRFILVHDYLVAYAPDESPCGFSQSCMDGVAPA